MYDIASATAALLALSFAYPIGAVLGRVSEKEIKANKKLFFKLDLTLFSLFTLGSVFFATIYYPLAGILGVLFGLLLVRVAHHINKINVVAVIMGLSYVFGRLGFEIMTLLAMFYLLTRVAITYYKHDDK
ncbi:MAG TPA: hypothetical protein ENG01_01230, partial [Candidatus Aenigmarchaeota archaeon]|nr:hypothetical protein [Candidatus Aenigmarchaeota archaeon]HEX33019.1 hypothetical protein [Candidatus Aenigmarchaeota archaeon]